MRNIFCIEEDYNRDNISQLAANLYDKYGDNYTYLTELVMILNHKCWEKYNQDRILSKIYEELYYKYDELAIEQLSRAGHEDELHYYLSELD